MRAIILIIGIAALGLASGCYSKSGRNSDTPFQIVATDAGFDAPDKVPAGLRHIVYANHGSEIHEAMLIKLPQGMTAAGYVAAAHGGSSFPAGALDYSGPGLTSPGETTEIWSKLDPGQYIIICFNNGHADTTTPRPFTVEYTIADDEPPKEDVVAKLIDYRFELVGRLRKGVQAIRVETTGPSMHEMDIFRLHEGKTLTDVHRWRKNPRSSAPADAMGGVLDNHDIKRVVWVRINFTPGRYVFHCEMPLIVTSESTKQELTHADLGMSHEIEIEE
jgi:hypothetical protein